MENLCLDRQRMGVVAVKRSSHYQKAMLSGVSLLALSTALTLAPGIARAEVILPFVPLIGPVQGLPYTGSGGFMALGGSLITVTGAAVSNFTAIGGNGSGGGAGLGGAIFVGTGSTLAVLSSTFTGNVAKGGQGGVTGLTTGGALNAGGVLGAIVPFVPTALPGLPGVTFTDNSTLFGDGSGNGLSGTNGRPGGNAILVGPGMPGGIGGNGESGWNNNPVLTQALTDANNGFAIAARGVAEATTSQALAATGLTSAITGLSSATAQLTADTVAAAAVAASAADVLAAPVALATAAGLIANIAIDSVAEASAVIAETTAQGTVTLAASQLTTAIQAQTAASQQVSELTTQMTNWAAANLVGQVGKGGSGGNGGTGGSGGFGYAGGVGGRGGSGGVGGGGGQGGTGGNGGNGGVGGFGAGGSSGGNAGLGGSGLGGLWNGDAGTAGAGGTAGFGGGIGSTGTGYQVNAPVGGGGGSGAGGAIFIQQGGLVDISGNTNFINNIAVGGGSQNGGAAGAAAGNDIFLQGLANINLTPGTGNTINFNDANAIADDSAAGPFGAAQSAQGNGGTVTIFGGGLVNFASGTSNTYTGTTSVGGILPTVVIPALLGLPAIEIPAFGNAGTGSELRANDGDGLPHASLLELSGAGVLETSGVFSRRVGYQPGQVAWAGSGGFAAVGGPLTVTLSNNAPLTWGLFGFTTNLGTLVLGAADATNGVTFTNDILTLTPADVVSMTVVPNAAAPGILANADTATYTGKISGLGSLSVNDASNAGTLQLTGANSYLGTTLLNGGMLQLVGNGSIATSSIVNITNANATLDISQTNNGAAIMGLTGIGTVGLGTKPLQIENAPDATFNGAIQGSGLLEVQAGQQTFTGNNLYTGITLIDAAATLALSGAGSIAPSSGVVDNGLFDISATSAGAVISTLSGVGRVQLGSHNLALSAANDVFSGIIVDGGLNGGKAGSLTIQGGHERLTGINTYSGFTNVMSGAQLALVGTGSIAAAALTQVNGTLDIGATNNGAALITLLGSGQVNLGSQTLTLSNASSVFAGVVAGSTGGVTVAAGTEGLTGINTYGGVTRVRPNASLFLMGAGSIAQSANVAVDGLLDIAQANLGSAITTLSGSGMVNLGTKNLTLVSAADTFAGMIGGSGGLIVANGAETLSGSNLYTGATIIGSTGTLLLTGNGSVASSARVAVDGVFDIAQTSNGAAITTLLGTGTVNLGAATLILSAAADSFAGVIGGSGSLAVANGTETLSGSNVYTGGTLVNAGANLTLVGAGSITPSSFVSVNGSLDIAQTNAGTTISNLSGNGMVNLGAKTLTLANSNSGPSQVDTFLGVINGSGGLTIGSGWEGLTGVNTYTGATAINPGTTLALGYNGSIAASSSVAVNGTLDISAPQPDGRITTLSGSGTVVLGANTLTLTNPHDVFNGNISGAGGVAINNGIESFTGVSSYTGGTSVSNATFAVNSDAAMGGAAGHLALTNATLVTTSSFNTTRSVALTGVGVINTAGNTIGASGVISGTGTLVATGAGRLNLTGINSYSGGTLITGKTVVAINSDAALGDPAGTVEIQSGELLATAPITSNRTIIVDADGKVVSNGNNMNLNGPIILAALSNQYLFTGTTHVVGDWTADNKGLTVTAGSTLSGVGTVSDKTKISGIISPGNSPGTMVFTAPLELTNTATYSVNIDGTGIGTGAGNYSRILVEGAGNTFTAAGVLSPKLRNITGSATNTYTPPVGQSFTVVQATGGILGSFNSLLQPTSGLLAGSRFDALYTDNALTLYVTPATYTNLRPFNIILTSNQTSTGGAFDALRGAAGVRTSAASTQVLGYAMQQTPQAIPSLLNHLAGTVYGDALMGDVRTSQLYGSTITDRMNGQRNEIASDEAIAIGGPGISFWTNAFTQTSSNSASGNTNFNARDSGAVFGMDKKISADMRVGIAAGYSNGNVTSSATGASVRSDTGYVTGYASWTRNQFFIDGQLGLMFANYSASRWLGAVPMVAHGNGNGIGINGGVTAGLRYDVARFQIQPELALRNDTLTRGSLTETGASAASLNVNSSSWGSTRSLLGVRVQTKIVLADGFALTPNTQVHWAHELGGIAATTTASFVNAHETFMSNVSAKNGTDAALVSLGAQLSMPRSMSGYINVGTEIGRSSARPAVNGGFQWKW